MASTAVDVLIIGAGPTGLGAAHRLTQHEKEWMIVDASDEPGGLACTDVTPEGFLVDMGGHVIFSHYAFFDDLLTKAVGPLDDEVHWNRLERVSYVRLMDTWVAYPFQNNISALPVEEQITCLEGIVDATKQSALALPAPANFDEWIVRVMGEGIADIFMRPYNFKVWAVPTTMMQCRWLGERVATVDLKQTLRNVLRKKEAAGWGPNAVFRFPQEGGTGGIWKKVAALLPAEKIKCAVRVTDVDLDAHVATLSDGTSVAYKKLVSSVPLDQFLAFPSVRAFATPSMSSGLYHSSTNVLLVGLRGVNPHSTKCWLYFPEDNCPFYRATVFSHYAAANCPGAAALLPTIATAALDDAALGEAPADATPAAGPYWSLMLEVAESEHKPVAHGARALGGFNHDGLVAETVQGCIRSGLLAEGAEIVSLYHRRIEYGYPTPTLERDASVAEGELIIFLINVPLRFVPDPANDLTCPPSYIII